MSLKKWLIGATTAGAVAAIVTGAAVRRAHAERAPGVPAAEAAVPVSVHPVRAQDVPLELDALGTVVSLHAVKLRTQVGGQLVSTPFREGARVAKGQLVAVIDARVLEARLKQATGTRLRDQALRDDARAELRRLREALHDGSATEQAVDSQASLVQQYEAALLTDQGAIDELQVRIGYTRLRAPVAGRIGLRRLDAGNLLADDDPQTVATIEALAPIAVVFPLPQEQIARVAAAWRREGTLPVEALDRGLHHVIDRGRLLAIDSAIDPSSGTVDVKATFANAQGALFPEEFVNARLSLGHLDQALVVPQAAVRRGRDGDFLYTVGADRRAVLHRVQRGPELGGDIAVTASDLRPGDAVIVDGADRVEAGTRVAAP